MIPMQGSVVVWLAVILVLSFVKQNETYTLKVCRDTAQLWAKKKKSNVCIFLTYM